MRAPKSITLTDPNQIETMVRRVLDRGDKHVRTCYEGQLKENEGLAGTWDVEFAIETDGRTSRFSIRGRNGAHAGLEACIQRQVAGWQFQSIADAMWINKSYALFPQ